MAQPLPDNPYQAPRTDAARWAALSPLDRYALVKVAGSPRPERVSAAFAEIVGSVGR